MPRRGWGWMDAELFLYFCVIYFWILVGLKKFYLNFEAGLSINDVLQKKPLKVSFIFSIHPLSSLLSMKSHICVLYLVWLCTDSKKIKLVTGRIFFLFPSFIFMLTFYKMRLLFSRKWERKLEKGKEIVEIIEVVTLIYRGCCKDRFTR